MSDAAGGEIRRPGQRWDGAIGHVAIDLVLAGEGDDAKFPGTLDRLASTGNVELAVDRTSVALDGQVRNGKLVPNLLVGESPRQSQQNIDFAIGTCVPGLECTPNSRDSFWLVNTARPAWRAGAGTPPTREPRIGPDRSQWGVRTHFAG